MSENEKLVEMLTTVEAHLGVAQRALEGAANKISEQAAALTAAEARIKMAADALRHADAYLISVGHGDGTDGARIRKALSTLTGDTP